jgi:hypothetical protein
MYLLWHPGVEHSRVTSTVRGADPMVRTVTDVTTSPGDEHFGHRSDTWLPVGG